VVGARANPPEGFSSVAEIGRADPVVETTVTRFGVLAQAQEWGQVASSSSKIGQKTYRLAGIVCGIVLISFTGLVLYSITARYFFSAPPMWGEDIPKLLFVWMSFIGAGFAYLFGFNIRMTGLITKVPRQPRRVIEFLMHLAIVVMLCVILWYSLPVLQLSSRHTVLSTGLPDILTYLPLPLGCLLLMANEIVRLVRIARGGVDDSGSDPHEAL
jgi:TRAP-type C4-dicarboxylate transport system permease small subunit